MKILLTAINAKYIHSNLAVYSLKAYAKEFQDRIEIAEYTINHQKEQILKDIYRRKPDLVAFSCYIWNLDYVEALAADLGKVLPQVPVYAGGPEVSYNAKAFLKRNPAVKGVLAGEGEETFARLCRYYCERDGIGGEETKGEALEQIPGLILSEKEGQQKNRSSASVTAPCIDFSEIPFLYEDLKNFENRIIYYESSRGCPFSCSYCLSSIDKKVRFRNLELVKKELQFFLDHRVPQVKFVDRTFNCNRKRAVAIWQYLLEQDNGITNFHFEISADLLGEEELTILKQFRPGAVQLEIGVQSANPATIKEIRRIMDIERLGEVVAKVKSFGNIHQHLDLIAGLPFEDLNTFKKSFNQVYGMEPDQLQLGFLKVLKGSYMHQCAKEYELLYKTRPNYEVLSTKWLTFEHILYLKSIEEMVELYYNSGQFQATLSWLVKEYESPFDFYGKLAAFFEREGYEKNTPSRMARYQVLLDFIEKDFLERAFPERVEFYKELLTFDLYSREKIKTRPHWIAPQGQWERELMKKLGRQNHVEMFSYPLEVFREGKGITRPKKQETLLFFDYGKRNPLNHSAQIHVIEERSEGL